MSLKDVTNKKGGEDHATSIFGFTYSYLSWRIKPYAGYDVAMLLRKIKEYNGDEPFLTSFTDHNTINKEALDSDYDEIISKE